MTAKEFTVGQTAYLYKEYNGMDRKDEILECTVAKVGRVFVTDERGNRYSSNRIPDIGLISEKSYNCHGYLFPTMEALERYIERKKLVYWFVYMAQYEIGQLSLEKMKKVKAAFEEPCD